MTLYKVDFTTWENDGDYYKTVSRFLSTKEDVDFYVALAKKFVSSNRDYHGMGNEECNWENIDEIIEEMIESHPNMSENIKQEWQNLIGKEYQTYNKLCDEILSEPVEYDYGFCRVMDSTEVSVIEPGYWIEVKDKQAIFKEFNGNNIVYIYSVYAQDKNGEPDIFKLEWETQLCNLNEFEVVSKPDEVSNKVIELIK